MFNQLSKWIRQRFEREPSWHSDTISDEWFSAHFHAAAIVYDWLSPHLEIRRSCVLDFGCGDGIMALALALRYTPQKVLGVDITRTWPRLLRTARREIELSHLPANLRFRRIRPGQTLSTFGSFDAVFSWSAFEHIDRAFLLPVLKDIYMALRPGGLFFIQIEPLFYSPFGSHLGRFGIQPWAHLLLSEDELERQILSFSGTIPAVEIEYNFHVRNLEAYKRFIFGEYKKLNRITVEELIDFIVIAGFEILRENRGSSNLDIPEILLQQYRKNDLLTNEIDLLVKRLN